MSDAKTRAAARRQAILASKEDRLAKLTTKAKNEGDAAATARDPKEDPPLAELPRTPNKPVSYSNSITPDRQMGGMEDSFGWDPTQQDHFLRALMASRSREGTPQFPGLPPAFEQRGSSPFPMADPLSAMAPPPERPKTLLEKLLPLLHATSVVAFLLFFLTRANSYVSSTEDVLSTKYWTRWGDLATSSPKYGWSEEHQYVLYTFLALQLGLHSLRIFTQASPPRAPMLLSLALPHLPPPFPTVIQTGMRYFQMAGLLLDDISVFLVGIGIVIFTARWYTS